MTLLAFVLALPLVAWTMVRKTSSARHRDRVEFDRWLARQRRTASPAGAGTQQLEMFWWPAAPDCAYDRARNVLVHVAPAYAHKDPEMLEFPVMCGWDERSILTTLAEIEAL